MGRSPEEEIGYPLQYSCASLVAQLVKNPPAMQETWVQSLDWEDPLEKGKATLSSILAWRIPWTLQSMGSQRVRHDFDKNKLLQTYDCNKSGVKTNQFKTVVCCKIHVIHMFPKIKELVCNFAY